MNESKNKNSALASSSKSSKLKKDGEKPFKKLGLFMVYTKIRFQELKKEKPDLTFVEMNSFLQEEYKNLTEEQKKKWMQIAEE